MHTCCNYISITLVWSLALANVAKCSHTAIFSLMITICVILQQSSCRYSEDGKGAQMSGSISISSGDEEQLQKALAYIGPIAVAVDASNNAFKVSFHFTSLECTLNLHISQYYSEGVYSSTQCSSSYLCHAMLVTGYGTYNGNEYYLVKNRYEVANSSL